MYIIEAIAKFLKKSKKSTQLTNDEYDYKCNHVYLPIDKSGETFACTLCGDVIQKKNLPKLNPFEK